MCRILWNPKVDCSDHKISTSGNILSHANTLTVVYFNTSSFCGGGVEAESFGNWIYFRNHVLKPLLLSRPLELECD